RYYRTTNAAAMNPTNGADGILLVARLDGPTAGIARALVDKAMQAEADGLWGRAYFDLRGITNGPYKIGDDWMRHAAEACYLLGFETAVDQRDGTFSPGFPLSQVAFYAGWYDGNVSGPFAQPTVEFMPGAFAYHLHSFSATTLRSTTRQWAAFTNRISRARRTSAHFSRASSTRGSHSERPPTPVRRVSPGKRPSSATRSIVRSAERCSSNGLTCKSAAARISIGVTSAWWISNSRTANLPSASPPISKAWT